MLPFFREHSIERTLDRLFTFDHKKKEMSFAPDTADKIEQLGIYLGGRPGCKWHTDHNWHDRPYEYIRDWAKKRKRELDSGKVLKGAKFRYRRNPNTGKYQVRLRTSIKEALYVP